MQVKKVNLYAILYIVTTSLTNPRGYWCDESGFDGVNENKLTTSTTS